MGNVNKFKEIKGETIWELDEFINVIELHFGIVSDVLDIMKDIYKGLQQVKSKINVKKRKGNDVVIRFKEGGNIATFWFNNNSVSIRVVGDELFDKQKTINNVSELEKYNVVDIISRKVKLM